MLTLETLKKLSAISNEAIARIQNRNNQLINLIEKITADASRSERYREEQCAIEREKLMPAMSSDREGVRAVYENVKGQKQYWESGLFLLGLQKFRELPFEDAQIKLRISNELKLMPLNILGITYKNAIEEGNLPLIYQCFLAGESRRQEAGFAEFVSLSLDGVEVPEQAEALAAISQCWSNVSLAESLAAMFFGRRTETTKNLTMAREQQG